ncbi:RHS repeat domain-containing protein [Pseudarthrobacter sp. GA104]|uniref:RHS repeat domain-containing protein n=1 Tax=Pseudarthrobacter sp. GA104 TaxID=2676311 RepID=UPI001E593C1F|nr:RHS repeat-associated core domain-containing protein [Pseudarthrobacter sp. GA104]
MDGNGIEVLPQVIRYTGFDSQNDALPPDKTVTFTYEPRPDPQVSYVAGLELQQAFRLKEIGVAVQGQSVMTTVLGYSQSPATRRTLLNDVQQCDRDGICTKPTLIEWRETREPSFSIVEGGEPRASWGDLNADGLDDMLVPPKGDAPYAPSKVQLSNGSSLGVPLQTNLPLLPQLYCDNGRGIDNTFPQFGPATKSALTDLDADGKADFLGALYRLVVHRNPDGSINSCSVERSLQVFRNTTSDFTKMVEFEMVYSEPFRAAIALDDYPTFADMTGDGLPDWIGRIDADHYGFRRNLGGTPFRASAMFDHYQSFEDLSSLWSSGPGTRDPLSYLVTTNDGTGRASVVGRGPEDSLTVADYSKGLASRTIATGWFSTQMGLDFTAADVNGDGLTDIVRRFHSEASVKGVRFGQQALYVSLNTGNGYTKPSLWTVDGVDTVYAHGNPILVDDFDGDGADDLIWSGAYLDDSFCQPHPGGCRSFFLTSRSNGKFESIRIPDGSPPVSKGDLVQASSIVSRESLDFNGDGQTDFFAPAALQHSSKIYVRDVDNLDLVVGITDGLGKQDTFRYGSTGSRDVYTPNPTGVEKGQSSSFGGQWVVDNRTLASHASAQSVDYRYENGRFDLRGNGWLGFGSVISRDRSTGLTTEQTYDVSKNVAGHYPGRDQLLSEKRIVSAGQITHVSSTLLSPTYFARLDGVYGLTRLQTVTEERELIAGAPERIVSKDVTNLRFDSFGNQVWRDSTITWASQDGRMHSYFTSTDTRYQDNFDAWLVGRLRSASTTSRDDEGRSQTRIMGYEIDGETGDYTAQVIEPANGDVAVWERTDYAYDSRGLLEAIKRTDLTGNTREESFRYDDSAKTFPTSFTNAVGQSELVQYDSTFGVVVSRQDANNLTSRWTYDGFGRPRHVSIPGRAGLSLSYSSNSSGLMQLRATYAGGNDVFITLDGLGREVQRKYPGFDGKWVFEDRTYNTQLGFPEARTMPYREGQEPVTMRVEYDPLGRPVLFVAADGSQSHLSYAGLAISSVDEDGHTTATETDPIGNVLQTASWDDQGRRIEARYVYGPFGQLSRTIDPEGNESSLGYDLRGRQEWVMDADRGLSLFRYNAFSDLVGTSGPSGVIEFESDALGRTTRVGSRGTTASYEWDKAANGIGRLASATSPDGTRVSFSYDPEGRLIEQALELDGEALAMQQSYDQYGRPSILRYPSVAGRQLEVETLYSAYGEVRELRNAASGKSYWKAITKSLRGETLVQSYGNGLIAERTYDARGRVKSILSRLNRETVQNLRYDYSNAGLMHERSDAITGSDETFEYDALGRLSHWKLSQGSVLLHYGYEYSDSGNLLSRNVLEGQGSGHQIAYSALGVSPHAAKSRVTDAGIFDYYSLAGNQYQAYRRGGQEPQLLREIEYNANDLPSEVRRPGLTNNYRYDAFGRRIMQSSRAETTLDFGREMQRHIGADGRETYAFRLQASGEIVGEEIWEVGNRGIETEDTLYSHTDVHGTPAERTSESGQLVQRQRFDPFGAGLKSGNLGELPPSASTPVSDLGFTGHHLEDAFGIIDMGGRLYDPHLGGFLTPDPLVASLPSTQTLNPYSYVLNSPPNFVDPTGFEPVGWLSESFSTGSGSGFTFGFHYCSCGGSRSPGPATPAPTFAEIGRGGEVPRPEPRPAIGAGGFRSIQSTTGNLTYRVGRVNLDGSRVRYSDPFAVEAGESTGLAAAYSADAGLAASGVAQVRGLLVGLVGAGRSGARAVVNYVDKFFNRGRLIPPTPSVSSGLEFKPYIPRTASGEVVELSMNQPRGGIDVPLPDPRANGYAHTVLGGRYGSDGSGLYRQSATFTEAGNYTVYGGHPVPLGRIDWTTHNRPLQHAFPHIHGYHFDGRTLREAEEILGFPLPKR